MKKLLAVLALALIASPAMALTIVGSPHDLSAGAGEELCVYCHTPHAAATAVAPLWNRALVNPGTSYTGTGTFSQNGLNNYTGTDVALCLSCHDGTTLMNAVINQPSVGAASVATAVNNSGTEFVAIGTDLSNDHPVGFNYASAVTADAEIRVPPLGWGTAAFKGTLANNTLMQCSSCHDVHDNANGAFLAMSNANSNLCVQCHIK